MSNKFLDIEPQYSKYENSKFVVIPVPYEGTTTYGRGTKKGPRAILKASQQVETFDEELEIETYQKAGIHTTKKIRNPKSVIQKLNKDVLGKNKIPVLLGGEHSITAYVLPAFKKFYGDLSVLQLDAHADLRDSYKGTKHNHACVMRRVLEVCPAVQVGIRNLSAEGYNFAKETGQLSKIHFAHKTPPLEQVKGQLSKDVYITIDTDVFDPSFIPATGAPEPGGMFWSEVLNILREVCRAKNIVGFDVVELVPIAGQPTSDFAIAKLVYKVIGYLA